MLGMIRFKLYCMFVAIREIMAERSTIVADTEETVSEGWAFHRPVALNLIIPFPFKGDGPSDGDKEASLNKRYQRQEWNRTAHLAPARRD